MSRYDEQFSNYEQRGRGESYYGKNNKRKKITVVLYKNEIHLMGAPNGFEVVVLNLDKGMMIENDDDTYDE
jgi:hypothetical protein